MDSDIRQERGLALARDERIKHVDGSMWFVPSDNAGGHLVNVDTATCTCPDFQRHRQRCKHLFAVEIVRAQTPPRPTGEVTKRELKNVQAAIHVLRRRYGSLAALAEAMQVNGESLKRAAYRGLPSASTAIHLARFAGVPVEDMLSGKFPQF